MKSRCCHPMCALALALPIACAAGSADAESDCAGLVNVKLEEATITSASVVSGPSTIGGAHVAVPFCRVEGVARRRPTRRFGSKSGCRRLRISGPVG